MVIRWKERSCVAWSKEGTEDPTGKLIKRETIVFFPPQLARLLLRSQ